jgi:hypothetical protein
LFDKIPDAAKEAIKKRDTWQINIEAKGSQRRKGMASLYNAGR